MRKLIFLLFLLPLLLMATTTDISDQIGQIELTSPAENQFLTYYDDSGNLILINSDDLELDEMILDSLYVRAINIESDGTGAKLTITGKTDTGADAVIILSATGATAVQGLKLWYDRSTACGYIDNQYNNDAGNIYIRTKTAGTPINAISILGTGNISMAGDLDVTTDLTAGTVGAAAITATGIISGMSSITLDTDPTEVLTAAMCKNMIRFNNDADVIDYTLPAAEAGLVVMFYDIGGGVITIDPYDGTDTIYLNGTAITAGYAIDSPGVVGDFICLIAIDATRWLTAGRSGTWVDGGTD